MYRHVQYGGLHWILYGSALATLVGAWFARGEPFAVAILLGASLAIVCLAGCFHHLVVEDEGDRLSVRFGPVPLFGTRLLYADMREAASDRTRVIDGWGIHWILGRGWTYNLWGFDCVRVRLDRKTIRIGTDDPGGLTALLRSKIGDGPASAPGPGE